MFHQRKVLNQFFSSNVSNSFQVLSGMHPLISFIMSRKSGSESSTAFPLCKTGLFWPVREDAGNVPMLPDWDYLCSISYSSAGVCIPPLNRLGMGHSILQAARHTILHGGA